MSQNIATVDVCHFCVPSCISADSISHSASDVVVEKKKEEERAISFDWGIGFLNMS